MKQQREEMGTDSMGSIGLCYRFCAELQRQAAHTSAKIKTCARADKRIWCHFGMSHYKHPSGHDLPLILDQVTEEKADGATEPHHLQIVDRQF